MTAARAVMVAATDLVAPLRSRANLAEDPLVFSDAQPLEALEAITELRPPLVILERFFAAAPRGAALIQRIKMDPSLAGTQIRVMAHDSDYSRVVARPPAPQAETVAPALDYHGTRRAQRYKMRPSVEVVVDGVPSSLVDLSQVGAQIVRTKPLRPRQRVRLTLVHEDQTVRAEASVAWAKFEVPQGQGYYRVGLEFLTPDTSQLDAFCQQHRADAE